MQTSLMGSKDPIYTTPFQTVRRIVAEEGVIRGLYLPGLTASMMREMSYSSIRFGLYTPFRSFFIGSDGGDAGLAAKILSGGCAGSIGSVIATPTDVVKIRLQKETGLIADGVYTTGLHRGLKPTYSSTLGAFSTIFNEGGLRGLYLGWQPTMIRAACLAGSQLAVYDHFKYTMKKMGWAEEGFPLHVASSLVAAVNTTMVTQPFDTTKTILITGTGGRSYSGPLECMTHIVKTRGVLFLYRGALPSFSRFGPHFIMAMPLWEKCRAILGLAPV
jgi:hypothetical protein